MSKDRENLKKAIQAKEAAIERYDDQTKMLNDPKVNAVFEGILHNEIRHKATLDDHLNRLS